MEKQVVTYNLGVGIDTKTDNKLVSNKNLELENVVFTRIGELQKRYGLKKLSNNILGGSTISNPRAIIAFQDELNLITSEKLYSYSEGADRWVDKGICPGVSVTRESVVNPTGSVFNSDIAYANGHFALAYEIGAHVYCILIDEATGNSVINNILIETNSYRPKIAVMNDKFYIFYNTNTNALKCRTIQSLNPTGPATAITVQSDCRADYPMDLTNWDSTHVIVGYTITATNNVKLILLDSSLNTINTITHTVTAGTILSIALAVWNNNDIGYDGVFLITSSNNSTYGHHLTYFDKTIGTEISTAQVAATAHVLNSTLIHKSKSSIYCYTEYDVTPGTNSFKKIQKYTVTNNGDNTLTIGTVADFILSLGLNSKPWIDQDSVYLIGSYDSTLQPSYFTLLDSSNKGKVANQFDYQIAYGNTQKTGFLSHIANYDTYKYAVGLPFKNVLYGLGETLKATTALHLAKFNTDGNKLFNYAQYNNNLMLAGGHLKSYDGMAVVESGFHLYPEIEVEVKTIGSLIGTFSYVAVYEWTDARGNKFRSAPSIPVSTGAITSVDPVITVHTLRVTAKTSPLPEVSIAIYRTEDAGTIYYRVTDPVILKLNDPTTNTVTFTDNMTDVDLIDNEILYTTGNVLENIVPPACTQVNVYKNRLIIAGLEEENSMWISKESQVDIHAEFNDNITSRIDDEYKGITGIIALDEKLIIFKYNSIYAAAFNGPNNLGENNDIITPQLITCDVGCVNSESICRYYDGLIFYSQKGYYLLNRSLGLKYVGAEAEDFNLLTPSGAFLIGDTQQIRLPHSDGDTLQYDYYYDQWATFTNYKCIGATIWNDRQVLLREDGTVDLEDKTTWMDNGSHVQTKIVTPWMQLHGVQGFQRVYNVFIIGRLRSHHKLQIEIGYDFETSFRDSYLIDTATALGTGYYGSSSYYGASTTYGDLTDTIYQFRIKPATQKCQAMRFRIKDVNPELIDGGGFAVTALTLEVGIKSTANKIPASKSMIKT